MFAITTSDGRTFAAQGNESLLDAALRQGVGLGYSCRTGRCSSCKGRVRAGETVAVREELGLSAADVEQGYVLTCVRQARSAVDLEIDGLGDIVLPEVRTAPCRIDAIERLARDVLRVTLRLPPSLRFEFLPGQYITAIGPAGLHRSYSIASAPRADRKIELHIRKVREGAMSHYWFEQARVNDLLRVRGPLGTFFLREQAGKDLVLLATGTGIAPVKAILESLPSLAPSAQPRSISLYWGARHRDDFYWQPPNLPGLHYVPVLSRADDAWSGARGYVQNSMLVDNSVLCNTLVYASGSNAMVHSARTQLCTAGLPGDRFHSDAFVCSAET